MSSQEARQQLREIRRLQRRIAQHRKKPKFLRYLSWRFWKFERREYWRKPRGNDNKMRLQLKGYPPIVKAGYRTDATIRGLHPSGLTPVLVETTTVLNSLDPSKHIIIISSRIGLRKRLKIIEEARSKGFRIANA